MDLSSKKIINLVHNDFEDLEVWYPVYRLREEGITVHIVGEKAKEKYVGKGGSAIYSDFAYGDVNVDDYDGVLVPGGWAPDRIRRYPAALDIVSRMNESGKLIGHVCHGGWVLVSAKVLKGRKVTGVCAIRDDMENAGAIWVDEPAVVDGNIVSGRVLDDLPPYMKAFVEELKK